MSKSPEFRFGDETVIVDSTTTARPHGYREFIFRVRRPGIVTVYRFDVPIEDLARATPRQTAEYLLRQCRSGKAKLFEYLDPESA